MFVLLDLGLYITRQSCQRIIHVHVFQTQMTQITGLFDGNHRSLYRHTHALHAKEFNNKSSKPYALESRNRNHAEEQRRWKDAGKHRTELIVPLISRTLRNGSVLVLVRRGRLCSWPSDMKTEVFSRGGLFPSGTRSCAVQGCRQAHAPSVAHRHPVESVEFDSSII